MTTPLKAANIYRKYLLATNRESKLQKRWNTRIRSVTLAASLLAALAACGGGTNSTTADTPNSNPPDASNPANSVNLTGTVAVGRALTNAPVTMKDATGKTKSTTSDSNGHYTLDVTGLSTPFVITSIDPFGVAGTQYSVVPALPTSGNNVVANVTPLTTAVTALLTASGNPADVLANVSAVTKTNVNSAVSKLNTALSSMLVANGLNATTFDPIGQTFVPDQTGADAVIDSVLVTNSATGAGLQIASLSAPNTAIQLNSGTTVTGQLATVTQPANYLASLQNLLMKCMSDKQSGATTSTACDSAIDTSYKHYGKDFSQNHASILVKGAALTGIKTVAFLTSGTLPTITNPAALVNFMLTAADGTKAIESDIVQQKSDGSWDIIGNQQDYDIRISPFLGRVQSIKDHSVRYESGVQIDISSTIFGSINPSAEAVVKGPGLPTNGLYLGGSIYQSTSDVSSPYASTADANQYLTIGASMMNGTTTSQYKMTWANADGSSLAKPASTSDYASSQVDLTTLPQFGVYTVTMYNGGQQQGQPQKVLSIAPYIGAQAGPKIAWQTLNSDVVTNYMTDNGAGAIHAVSALNLSWTAPANGAYSNFWSGLQVSQAKKDFNTGAFVVPQIPSGLVYSYRSYTKPTVNSDGSYSQVLADTGLCQESPTCQGGTMEGLVGEFSRMLTLGWQTAGVYYTNTWQYTH